MRRRLEEVILSPDDHWGYHMFEPIPFSEFTTRVGLSSEDSVSKWSEATHVVSLRSLVSIEAIQPMRRDYRLNSQK